MKTLKLAALLVAASFALSACDVPPRGTEAQPMAKMCCDKKGKNCKPANADGVCVKKKPTYVK
ncbi:MAG: hypothetical protein AB7G06_05740 [Bdellovibrionales bacterium]